MGTRWLKRLLSKEGTENLWLYYKILNSNKIWVYLLAEYKIIVLHEQANDYGF